MRRPMLALLLILGCGDEHADRTATAGGTVRDSAAGPPGTLLTADTATVDAPLSLPAQLYVEHDAVVFARSAGVVESVLVDLGDRVKRDQVIATLERTDQALALEQARHQYDNDRQRVERQRALKTAGVVTQADSEQVEFEYREAELALRKTQRDYDLTRISAPFDGVVTSRTARVGRLVSAGDTLFQVTALGPVLARVRVPESSAFGLAVGSSAQVLGARGAATTARVVRASPVVDAASGTREVVLQLGSGARLTPGSSVTVRLGSERRRVVTVPRSAIGPEGYALVWDNDRTTLRAITLGSDLDGGRVEVVSGLAPGERVVPSAP